MLISERFLLERSLLLVNIVEVVQEKPEAAV